MSKTPGPAVVGDRSGDRERLVSGAHGDERDAQTGMIAQPVQPGANADVLATVVRRACGPRHEPNCDALKDLLGMTYDQYMSQNATSRELGQAIREARMRVGLSQAALGDHLGVSRITIGRLERGEDVSMTTALAALRACGLGLSTVEARGWLTACEHAKAIDRELETGDPDFALRLLRQALEDLDYLIERSDGHAIELFFAREPRIGDARWESFFKLTLLERCRRNDIATPRWNQSSSLPEPFFPARPSHRFISRTIERTLPSFAQANVWIDERDLAYA